MGAGPGQALQIRACNTHSRPMLPGLYIQVLSGYGQYLIYGPTPCMCIHRVQACIPYAYTGLYTRAYRLCIRACIHRVYAMQAAYPLSGLHPGLAGMARTGHIPACKPLRGNQDPGLCIQGLARPAHHWIYPWDTGSGRGRDITSCPSYRPRACGRLYTHAHA